MTRDQIKKWEDEAHNYADHVTSDNPDADWNAVFHTRFAQLARADMQEQCLNAILDVCERYRGTSKGLAAEKFCDNCEDAIRAIKA